MISTVCQVGFTINVMFAHSNHVFDFNYCNTCLSFPDVHETSVITYWSVPGGEIINCYIRFHVSRRHCRWCAKTESLQWSPNLMKNEKDCQLYLRGLLYRCCTCSYKCQILHLKHFCWNWRISKILNAYFTISATQHNNSFQYFKKDEESCC